MSTPSRACRRPSRSSRRPPARTRGRPSARSPRSTTTSGCSGPGPGVPHCPNDGSPVSRSSASQITDAVLAWPEGTRIEVLAPLVRGRKGEFRDLFEDVRKRGFVRVRVDGETYDLGVRARAQPAAEPRYRGGRRPARRARRGPRPARRFDRDGAQAGRRRGRGGAARGEGTRRGRSSSPSVLPVRYADCHSRSSSRGSSRSTRPFGACPDCNGLGTRKRSERRPDPGRPEHLDPRGRGPALGRAVRLPAEGGAADAGQGVQVRPGRALGRASRLRRRRRCCTARRASSSSPPRPAGAVPSTRRSGKASSRTSSAAIASRRAMRSGASSSSS